MCLIKKGPSAGIYVAFVQYIGGKGQIYFTKKPFGGTFTTPVDVAASADDLGRPIIVYFDDKLIVYYNSTDVANKTLIEHSYFDFGVGFWQAGGKCVDIGSTKQIDFSLSTLNNQLWLVWSDNINSPTTGYDLHAAWSIDGSNFQWIRNISSLPGLVDEYATSTACGNEEIVIAYLARSSGSSRSYGHLKVINSIYDCIADWSFISRDLLPDETFTVPCVANSGVGIYLVGYGIYDTVSQTLKAKLSKFVGTLWIGRFDEYPIFKRDAGTVFPMFNGGQIYPCLGTFNDIYNATEGICVYRDFTDGYFVSGTVPQMTFGNLYATYFVADGDED